MSPAKSSTTPSYRERLWPSPGVLVMLLLLIPAAMLTMMPLNQLAAIPIAVGIYVLIAGSLVAMSPAVAVRDGMFIAGKAKIPVELLGEIRALDADGLRAALGPGSDARAYLMVRGYVHRAIKVQVEDSGDSTPYWVVTSRNPRTLAATISEAKQVVAARANN